MVLAHFLTLLTLLATVSGNSLRIDAFKKESIPSRQRIRPRSLRETPQQRIPQVLVIGVRKCGTRALLEFMNLHPLIAAASDEMHFFDDDETYGKGLDFYRRLMPFTFEDQITVEKTPAYFSRSYVPKRVKDSGIDFKFIIVFRDPVLRTISDYTQVLTNRQLRNATFSPFEKMVFKNHKVNKRYKAINISTYIDHMRNWLEYFPLSQFHFVDGDKMVVDPATELKGVEKFLGLSHEIGSDLIYFNKTRGFYCMKVAQLESDSKEIPQFAFKNKCLRPDKGRHHPTVSNKVISELRKYFAPFNEQLFYTIGKRFSWPTL